MVEDTGAGMRDVKKFLAARHLQTVLVRLQRKISGDIYL